MGGISHADVFILSPQFFDISTLLYRDDCLVLDDYISQDTREDLWCLDLLKNTRQQLIALPMFIGVYMLNNSMGIDFNEYATPLYPWQNVFNSYGSCEVLTEDFLLILTRQVEQLTYLCCTDKQSEDTLRCYLEDIKLLTGTAILLNGMHVTDSMKTLPVEHGMLCDWFQKAKKNSSLYCALPQYGVDNMTPLAFRVGIVAQSAQNAKLAVAFLESFVSLEAQFQLPTAGCIRRDLWQEMNLQYSSNSDWAIENRQWWGLPVSAETFQQYQIALQSGFIGCGAFQQTQEMTDILWSYISGQLTLETTIDYFFQAIMHRSL